MKQSLGVLIIVYFVFWLTALVLQIAVRRRLRAFYPEIAARVAPGFLHNNIAASWAWFRFIIRREYRSLDRPGFVLLCDFYLAAVAAFSLLLVIAIVMSVLLQGSAGRP